jgi:hypothetical protein
MVLCDGEPCGHLCLEGRTMLAILARGQASSTVSSPAVRPCRPASSGGRSGGDCMPISAIDCAGASSCRLRVDSISRVVHGVGLAPGAGPTRTGTAWCRCPGKVVVAFGRECSNGIDPGPLSPVVNSRCSLFGRPAVGRPCLRSQRNQACLHNLGRRRSPTLISNPLCTALSRHRAWSSRPPSKPTRSRSSSPATI